MNLPVNPVLARELRERTRGARASVILTVYLALLSGILYLVYYAGTDNQSQFGSPLAATEVAAVGRGIFEWILFFMFLLVIFLVPGLTSGAISGERERQTLVPLQVTLLRPRAIVIGKVLASVAYLLLLVAATAPLLTISYLIGGVTMASVLAALGAVIATGMILAAITVACSAVFRRTQTATVMAYALALVMVLGTFLAYAVAGVAQERQSTDFGFTEQERPPESLLLLNPLVMAADLIGSSSNDMFGIGADSPFDPLHEIVNPVEINFDQFGGGDFGPVFGPVVTIGPGGAGFEEVGPGGFVEVQQPDDPDDGVAFWVRSLALLTFLAALSLVVATRRVRTPARTER